MKNSFVKILILATVVFMDILTGMEFDLFVPSFPQLQSHFALSPFWVEALLSINFIGYCLSLFFVGGLADRYGRKPIILLGLTIFIPFLKTSLNDTALSLSGYGSIVKSKPLMLLITNILFIFVPYWIFVGMSPLLYIKDLNVSLAHFGYYQGVLAFVFAIGSIVYGLIIRGANFNQKGMLKISMQILMVSLAIITIVTIIDSKNPLIITFAFLPFIISQIIPSVILYPLSLNFLPHAKAKVSAIIQGARLILTALGLQIAGYFYQQSFQSIGIVLICFIIVALITLFFVLNNDELMDEKEGK